MHQDTLSKIGLTENESKVYEILLNEGEIKPTQIIKQTGLTRGVAYFILDTLVEKNLAQKIKKNKRVTYAPKHPTEILNIINQGITRMHENRNFFETILPQLIQIYNKSAKNPTLLYYDGKEGVKKVYMDTLNSQTDIHAILQGGEIDEEILEWIRGTYIHKRIDKEIFARVILAQDEKADRYIKESPERHREVLTVSKKEFPIEMEVNIYGDRVAFISYHKDAPHFGVIIDSPYVAKTALALWKLAWVGAQKEKVKEYKPTVQTIA